MNKLTKFLLLGVGAPLLLWSSDGCLCWPVSLAQPVVSAPSMTEKTRPIAGLATIVIIAVRNHPRGSGGDRCSRRCGCGCGQAIRTHPHMARALDTAAATASADALGGIAQLRRVLFGGSSWHGDGDGDGRGWGRRSPSEVYPPQNLQEPRAARGSVFRTSSRQQRKLHWPPGAGCVSSRL